MNNINFKSNTLNSIEPKLSAGGKGTKKLNMQEFIELASETPDEETDLEILSTLKELPQWLKENPGKSVMDFYEEKGLIIKRIELSEGSKVVSLSDYMKQKQKPEVKKINLAHGDFSKTVAGLSAEDKDLIKDLLRKSGVIVGD